MEQEKSCNSCKNKGFKTKHMNMIFLSVFISICTIYGFIQLLKDLVHLFY